MMYRNLENMDLTNILDYLLKNYKKYKITVSASGRKLYIGDDFTMDKILLSKKNGEVFKDYVIESPRKGADIITYNCFDFNGSHIYLDDTTGNWQKLAKLNDLCIKREKRKRTWKKTGSVVGGTIIAFSAMYSLMFLIHKDFELYRDRQQKKENKIREQARQDVLREYGLDTISYSKQR